VNTRSQFFTRFRRQCPQISISFFSYHFPPRSLGTGRLMTTLRAAAYGYVESPVADRAKTAEKNKSPPELLSATFVQSDSAGRTPRPFKLSPLLANFCILLRTSQIPVLHCFHQPHFQHSVVP